MSRAEVARIHLVVVGCVCFLASPSFAGKQAISDQDLDRVSAAGGCKAESSACDASEDDSSAAQTSAITQGTNGLRVTTTMNGALALDGAQQSVQTLILNNVVGGNQIANGINLSGGGPR